MRISVAIAALNEGPDLEATVALCLAARNPPDEIVVVDDASVDPIKPRLERWPGVRVIRNDTRRGSGPSKHIAANDCFGDLVVVMDSHMRPSWEFADRLRHAHLLAPSAVLCPVSTGFETGGDFRGMGAELALGEHGFWEARWAPPNPGASSPYCVPAAMGGCYAIPQAILREINGYAPGLRGYGMEEEFLALRVWMAGFEIRVVPNLEIPHQYRRDVDRASADGAAGENPGEMVWNRHWIADWCFGTGVYREFYAERIGSPPGIPMTIDHKLVAQSRDGFTRLRTDNDLARLIGVRHPGE